MSTQYEDYQNEINNTDDNINKPFNYSHNNEIPSYHKSFNKEEKYIQESRTVSSIEKDRRKGKEESRKKFGK
jgi:hypothetical protein